MSAATISRTTAHLAEELEQYRTAPIADEEVEFLSFWMGSRHGSGGRCRAENSALPKRCLWYLRC